MIRYSLPVALRTCQSTAMFSASGRTTTLETIVSDSLISRVPPTSSDRTENWRNRTA